MSYSLFATKYKKLFPFVVLICAFFGIATASEEADAPLAADRGLSLSDCKKCHPHIVDFIEKDGGAHKNKVTCVNCHEGHPPKTRGIIPQCSKCHKNEKHFDLPNCLQCHTNPHTPLNISLTRNITTPCTTCHTTQFEQLQKFPSIHTTLDCTACHTKHGYVPQCFNCHAPHLESMDNDTCLSCHHAHRPLEVTYSDNTPSDYCGSCHIEVYKKLGESHAKHRKLPCVSCHQLKHKAIPKCQNCHHEPHPAKMLAKFSNCGNCHGTAHELKFNQVDLQLQSK